MKQLLVILLMATASLAQARNLTLAEAKAALVQEINKHSDKYFEDAAADVDSISEITGPAKYYFARWQTSGTSDFEGKSKVTDKFLEQLDASKSPVDLMLKNRVSFGDLEQRHSYAAFNVLMSPNVYLFSLSVEHCSNFEFSFAVSAVTGKILEIGQDISPDEM